MIRRSALVTLILIAQSLSIRSLPTVRFSRSSPQIVANMKNIRSYFAASDPASAAAGAEGSELPRTKKAKRGENESATAVTASNDTGAAQVLPAVTTTEPPADGGAKESSSDSVVCPLLENLDPSWRERLSKEFRKPYFQALLRFLEAEKRQHTVFPPENQTFTALNLCPFDQVKVVIIGQDPYHGPGQAHGLAFSVQRGVPAPPSLKNMISELQSDPETRIRAPTHGNLECWSRQGVLLLNTCLTVRKGEANSHQKHGWEEFTDAIVGELRKRSDVVYLLWGKPAYAKCASIDHTKNVILTSSHPSPLAAYKTNEPFMGSRIFSRCNKALVERGQSPIDWNIV